MFFGRKQQPERPLSLSSLDERLRRIEALLMAPEAKPLPRTLAGALTSLAKRAGFEFPH